jgi:hypothetical protein
VTEVVPPLQPRAGYLVWLIHFYLSIAFIYIDMQQNNNNDLTITSEVIAYFSIRLTYPVVE